MMEAAKTVKRYSALPKTITSDPKSHFVFRVLPIAHVHFYSYVSSCTFISFLGMTIFHASGCEQTNTVSSTDLFLFEQIK